METPNDTGVKGFFEDYDKRGGLPNTKKVTIEGTKHADKKRETQKARSENAQKVRARTGRPPGVPSGSRSAKAKATMHINKSLMDFYRDWSWEAKCNLGELIERAMVAYKNARKSAATTDSRAGDN